MFHRGGAEETPRRDQRGHAETGAGEGALEKNRLGAEDERGSENEVENPSPADLLLSDLKRAPLRLHCRHSRDSPHHDTVRPTEGTLHSGYADKEGHRQCVSVHTSVFVASEGDNVTHRMPV